jgi:predicted PurR-regulated permease PerM
MILIGSLSWLGLEIVGMNFALPMGVIAGFLEVIPNVGPTISLVLALVFGAGSSAPAWKIIFIAIQQFENFVIVPQLMRKVIGTSPVLTLIALLGASKIFGLWGTLLAVPAVAIFQISFRFYLKYKNPEVKQSKS